MKLFLIAIALAVASPAFAASSEHAAKRKPSAAEVKCAANPNEGIGIDPDYVAKQIQAAGTCYDANEIANACAAGSSMDTQIAGSAAEFCDKATGKLGKSDAALKSLMTKRCAKVCNPRTDGTMCIGRQAFCGLDVSRFLNSVSNNDAE